MKKTTDKKEWNKPELVKYEPPPPPDKDNWAGHGSS